MDILHFNIFTFFTTLVSLIILQQSTTNAEFYTIKNRHIPAKSSPGGDASLPISAHSQTECILKCKNKAGGENPQPFYSNQNECFCLKDDQRGVDTPTSEKGKGINGSLFTKVS